MDYIVRFVFMKYGDGKTYLSGEFLHTQKMCPRPRPRQQLWGLGQMHSLIEKGRNESKKDFNASFAAIFALGKTSFFLFLFLFLLLLLFLFLFLFLFSCLIEISERADLGG